MNTCNSKGVLTRPITIKRSSRPVFLIMVDLTYILARTRRVATATKVDCIARKAEDSLVLGRINAGAETLLDQAIMLRQNKRADDGGSMKFGQAPTILSQERKPQKTKKEKDNWIELKDIPSEPTFAESCSIEMGLEDRAERGGDIRTGP